MKQFQHSGRRRVGTLLKSTFGKHSLFRYDCGILDLSFNRETEAKNGLQATHRENIDLRGRIEE